MKDYSYLEGMRFTFFDGCDTYPGRVLYADYDIGLTCVNDDFPEEYLICVRGPSAPFTFICSEEIYQYIWEGIVTLITQGHVEGVKIDEIINKYVKDATPGTGAVTSDNCAFGQ